MRKVNDVVYRDFAMLNMLVNIDVNKYARLVWGSRNGLPRITVFTGEVSDEQNRKEMITAGMDHITAMAFLTKFEEVLNGPNGVTEKIINYTMSRSDGSNGEKVIRSTTFYGKDENGIAWISLVEEGKSKVKFEYRVSPWHQFTIRDSNGSVRPMTESEGSILQAKSTLKVLKHVLFKTADAERQRAPDQNGSSNTTAPAPSTDFDDIGF